MTFTVTLKQSGRQFPVAAGESVLEAGQRAGVALPYSCRAGVCGSCKATLLAGECIYPRNPPVGLDASAIAHHAVLLCQAVPASDLLLEAREQFAALHARLARCDAQIAAHVRNSPAARRGARPTAWRWPRHLECAGCHGS